MREIVVYTKEEGGHYHGASFLLGARETFERLRESRPFTAIVRVDDGQVSVLDTHDSVLGRGRSDPETVARVSAFALKYAEA